MATSSENGVGSNVESENLITEKMMTVEEQLEKENALNERLLMKQKMEEVRLEQEEQSYKRLHLLLSQSGVFAKFIAARIQKEEANIEKRKTSRHNNKLKDLSSNVSNKNSKALTELQSSSLNSPKKKLKLNVNAMDAYNDESVRNKVLGDINNPVASKNLSKTRMTEQPLLLCGGTMRDYQLEGLAWMKTLFEHGVNGILADEMGLGKTIQTIAIIAHLIEMGVSGPFFICGPLLTVPNWCAEFKRFTPDIPVILYHGEKQERKRLLKKVGKTVKLNGRLVFPVVVTSYQIALIDAPFLSKIFWRALVIDEAHRIKNYQCKLVQALKKFTVNYRLLLTGTPLQNDLSELWSLLNFILPEIFNDLQVFQTWFDITNLTKRGAAKQIIAREEEKRIVSMIHEILAPFLLRRTKADVELGLPLKKELLIHAPFTPLQLEYYRSVLDKSIRKKLNVRLDNDMVLGKREPKNTDFLGNGPIDLSNIIPAQHSTPEADQGRHSFIEINVKLGNSLMMLRKICCHPYLVAYPMDLSTGGYLVDENLVTNSGKIRVLDQLLPELKQRGHKVLLFTQFVLMMDILIDYCTFRGFKFCSMHGNMKLEERNEEMDRFKEDPSVFLFLISTRAGGLGINLTSADTVIIYDSDWNPQSDLQAQDRCHRIGQAKPVVVYRLMIPNTIDEYLIKRAVAKRKLEKAIMHNGAFKSIAPEKEDVSIEELKELLEASDFQGQVKVEENALSREELERLLDRSDLIRES